mmetsp:Transcript_167499/g.537888  ORF Transcript_167499/g.537888 Transcript_167499/m.537888 type:complete len:123 (-) Transcript_167499:223-591(-)
MTRADFLKDATGLRCKLFPDLSEGAPQEQPEALQSFVCKPRLFKSGSAGWFQSSDVNVQIGEKTVRVKAQLVIMMPASKHWADGEGLLPSGAASAGSAAEAEADPEADPEAEAGVEEVTDLG